MRSLRFVALCTLGWALVATAQETQFGLTIEKVMTPEELRTRGVTTLTPTQRIALNRWLTRYTKLVISSAQRSKLQVPSGPPARGGRFDCTLAIESSISGDFEGWSGETLFKLDNGQIWEQAEYDYMYTYDYHPDVTVYSTSSGCRMKVEGEEETILVRRIK